MFFFGHFIEFGWFDWPILHVMREENPRLSEVFQVSKGFLTLFRVFQGLTLSPLFTALQFSTSVEVRLGIVASRSVRYRFFRRTVHTIFPIFCMNVPYYKNKKRTRRFFREKSGSFKILRC